MTKFYRVKDDALSSAPAKRQMTQRPGFDIDQWVA
jgi:hypothetical protein